MSKIIDLIVKPLTGEWGQDDEIGNGIPVLRTTNFTDDGIIDYSNVVTRNIAKEKVINKFLRKGDIIIEKSGGAPNKAVGRVVYFEAEDNKYLFNNFTSVLRTNSFNCNSKYLFYVLYSNYKRGYTWKFQNKTTGIANLKLDRYIKETEIKIPPNEEQEKVVKSLDKTKEVIDGHKKQLEELDNLIKATFYHMFGDPISNDKGWGKEKLIDVCDKITDGTHDTPPRFEQGALFITGKNIRPFYIDLTDVEFVSQEDHNVIYKRCNPEFKDVLYTNIGVNYGTAAINLFDYEFSMKNVALLKYKRNLLTGEYLQCYLNYKRDFIISQNKTGGAQTFMGLATIKQIDIHVPPIEFQNQFAEIVTNIEQQKAIVKQSITESETLFNSLMSKYFD